MPSRLALALMELLGRKGPAHEQHYRLLVDVAATHSGADYVAADKPMRVELLLALVFHESTCQAGKIHRTTGCLGLMQLNPKSYPNMTREELLRPVVNISFGAWALYQYLIECKGDEYGAVRRYHGRRTCKGQDDPWARAVIKTADWLRDWRPPEV